jgi:hypothetical protein
MSSTLIVCCLRGDVWMDGWHGWNVEKHENWGLYFLYKNIYISTFKEKKDEN